MFEIVVAAAAPAGGAGVVAGHHRFTPETRHAVRWWFIPAALLWFAPCWATGGSPGGFDYLFRDIVPWRLPAFSGGNALLSDSVLQLLPWREAVRDSIAQGAMPYLNRYAGSGAPLWENPQAAVAYPLNLIGMPFSTFAWPLFAGVAKLLLSMTGMYTFLRGRRMSQEASIFGAYAWSFGAFSIAFLMFPVTNVTLLLPFLLASIDACGRTPRAVPALAIVIACMFFGGHPESVLHSALVAIPFAAALVMASPDRLAMARRCLIGGACGVALAAPILLPFAEYLPYTERVARMAEEKHVVGLPPLSFDAAVPFVFAGHAVGPLFPGLRINFAETIAQYVGLVTFALALFAAIVEWRKPFWTILFVTAAFFAFSSPAAEAITSRIPLLNLTANGRFRFVAAFAAVVLAARGITLLRERMRLFVAICAAVVVFVVVLMFLSWDAYATDSARVARTAIAAVGGGLLAIVAAWYGVHRLLPLAVLIDLAALLIGHHPPAARSRFYPETPVVQFLQRQAGTFRFTSLGRTLLPNSGVMLRLQDIGVHDPVGYGPYLDMLEAAGYNRRLYHNYFPRFPDVWLLRALGVRYVVTPPEIDAGWRAAYRGADANVFEVPGARPRVVGGPGTTIESVEYRPNRVRMVVRAVGAGWVGSGEAALPGWRLYRNGEPWPVEKTAVPLLSWKAPPGRSIFELRYRPEGLLAGLLIMILGIGLLVATGRSRQAAPAE